MFSVFVQVMRWGIKPRGENENRGRFYLRAVLVQSAKTAVVGLAISWLAAEYVSFTVAVAIFICFVAIGVILGLAVCG